VKKLLSALVAVAFVGGMVGLASAQTPSTTEKKADEKADKSEKKMAKKASSKSASGTVKSASADSLVVAGKAKGKETEWTFAVDPSTKIRKAGKDITPADLKAGDSVSVKYMDHEGKQMAQMVTVRGGGSAKKAAGDKMDKSEKKMEEKPAEKK
jgi:Ni/Co efflux regulator RcnB